MRVVGGVARGRALRAPLAESVRPTSERAREAIFDALGAIGAVLDATVLDLFAGSGALGIEALSRGAAHVTFVDHSRDAISVIEQNLRQTGFGGDGAAPYRVVRRDALSYLALGGAVDLALIDPPYAFTEWPAIFEHLDARVAVLESDRVIEPSGGYVSYRSYRYGGTLVHIVRRDVDAQDVTS